ncbi:biotin carboxylase, partial [Rhizobium leguminosarum bv. viciae]|nr:biotin carboxylase [Rhizobium leguminosarum bv. viciae]
MKRISNIAELRLAMRRNKRPIYFISPTNFNLMGIDEWVGNFKFINSIDCYDGRHPNVFVPSKIPHAPFKTIEDITNHLLQHPEVIDYITRRGGRPGIVCLMFNEKTEEICKKLG